ncbi:hypothetical protein B7Y94_05330 [Candidatus Saccharibacteria bacterium 32-49-12]|nr:MAG: hypothetical protein B7Y94_05330 [Candidatus Saccharibacteria bacterium 32-49-12]
MSVNPTFNGSPAQVLDERPSRYDSDHYTIHYGETSEIDNPNRQGIVIVKRTQPNDRIVYWLTPASQGNVEVVPHDAPSISIAGLLVQDD